jgi:hypothetical protein
MARRFSLVLAAGAASALSMSMAIVAPRTARAQNGLLLQGIIDGEVWSTDTTSNLLTRNRGRPATLARVQLWGAYEPFRNWVIYGQAEGEFGNGRHGGEDNEIYSNQFGIRFAPSQKLVIEAGRLTPIIGTFSSRRFSTRNPLIGIPDGYSLQYPLGVELSGEARYIDYRVGMVSLPAEHLNYVPKTTERLRPAIGGGVTPFVGARIGASFTMGPYLNKSLTPTQLGARNWADFDQRVIAFDASFSRGYLETHAEYSQGRYEVPNRAKPLTGMTYYGEAKYTFTPRLFLAARAERNHYPFIRATSGGWIANLTDFVDGEVGGGYRVTASSILKVSVRGDRWWVRTGGTFAGRGGRAVAVQWSQSFDALSWFERER